MKPILVVHIPYQAGMTEQSYSQICRWFYESDMAKEYHIVVVTKEKTGTNSSDWTFEIVNGVPAQELDEPTWSLILDSLNEDYKPRDDFR